MIDNIPPQQPQNTDTPVYHFYVDACAGNPGQEIVQVTGGQIRLLKTDGTEIQASDQFHSVGDKLGLHRVKSSGPNDCTFKLYTDYDGDGVSEKAFIEPDANGVPVLQIATYGEWETKRWQTGHPDVFVNGSRTSTASWENTKRYLILEWNWDDK